MSGDFSINRFSVDHFDAAEVSALHVLVCPAKDGGFVAQGIEIDFTATGETEDEARDHFGRTFAKTIAVYLEKKLSFNKLFASKTPSQHIAEYFSDEKNHLAFECVVIRRGQEEVDVPAVPRRIVYQTADCIA